MTDQECPKCGAKFQTGQGWAESTLPTLVVAPAVPDIATQVHCSKCQYLFADGQVRFQRAGKSGVTFWLVGVGIAFWAIYSLLVP